MGDSKTLVPAERIENVILYMRGEKVIIDSDLAALYGVTTKRLNEQVKRNRDRFPADFMFQLTAEEKAEVVANCDHLMPLKFSKGLPSGLYRTRRRHGGKCSQYAAGRASKHSYRPHLYKTATNVFKQCSFQARTGRIETPDQ